MERNMRATAAENEIVRSVLPHRIRFDEKGISHELAWGATQVHTWMFL